jgi:pimeloyl-ACP methyl ester carboxylesterase
VTGETWILLRGLSREAGHFGPFVPALAGAMPDAAVVALANRRDLWDATIRSWTQIDRERPVSVGTVRAQVASASRWRAPRSLEVPALFLVGQGDRLVHPDCTRRLAKRYGAPLAEHPDAGHDLTTDAMEWVVGELLGFRQGLVIR